MDFVLSYPRRAQTERCKTKDGLIELLCDSAKASLFIFLSKYYVITRLIIIVFMGVIGQRPRVLTGSRLKKVTSKQV